MEALQSLDQNKIIAFAQALKKQDGKKFVFFLYQQEFRPEISPIMLNSLISVNQQDQNILADIHELFQVYHRDIFVDLQKIVQAYSDSSADFNFLLMKRTPEKFGGITMREQSEDVFQVFSQVAAATGGIAESTQNPAAEVKDALKTAETYYLLSYTPTSAVNEGKFKPITVKVREKNYKVLNRRGYITS